MHPIRKRKLGLILLMLTGISLGIGLMLYALKQNINLFYTPSQIAAKEAPANRSFRLGGMVVKGSVHRSASDLTVTFAVTDNQSITPVKYTGILPDLFREGQGIVADGKLNSQGEFIAKEVLAKHDEKYTPPQLKSLHRPNPQKSTASL